MYSRFPRLTYRLLRKVLVGLAIFLRYDLSYVRIRELQQLFMGTLERSSSIPKLNPLRTRELGQLLDQGGQQQPQRTCVRARTPGSARGMDHSHTTSYTMRTC